MHFPIVTKAARVEVTRWKIKFEKNERWTPSFCPQRKGKLNKRSFSFYKGVKIRHEALMFPHWCPFSHDSNCLEFSLFPVFLVSLNLPCLFSRKGVQLGKWINWDEKKVKRHIWRWKGIYELYENDDRSAYTVVYSWCELFSNNSILTSYKGTAFQTTQCLAAKEITFNQTLSF